MSLNFKHLRYFWAVAHSGNLTRAAEQLFVSQSALSVQIRKLEEWLGHDLFERQGKRLVLTEAGRIALDHADTIFGVGEELVAERLEQHRPDRLVRRLPNNTCPIHIIDHLSHSSSFLLPGRGFKWSWFISGNSPQ